jgi:tetratricopeptide (TPR) repeat protein
MNRKSGWGVAGAAVGLAAGFALLIALLAGTAQAQMQSQQQQQQKDNKPSILPAKPPPVPPPPPPVSREEEDAYKALVALKPANTAVVITQGEAFLGKYPASRYRPGVYTRLVAAYLSTNQVEKMLDRGEKAIAEDPDNVDVLALMSTIIPRKVDPKGLDADQNLAKAEKYARHALELAAASQKPEGVADEAFTRAKNERLGMAHSGLGLVYYMKGRTADSVAEFAMATKLDPMPDPLDYFLLGEGAARLKKYSDAVAAFDRCAETQWAWQDRCKKFSDDVKKMAAAAPPASAKP